MWFLGHFCLAYLITKLATRKTFDHGYMLVLLLVFSNLPDILHFGILRTISHSFIGAPVVLLLGLGSALYFIKLNRNQSLLLLAAGFSHLLADMI